MQKVAAMVTIAAMFLPMVMAITKDSRLHTGHASLKRIYRMRNGERLDHASDKVERNSKAEVRAATSERSETLFAEMTRKFADIIELRPGTLLRNNVDSREASTLGRDFNLTQVLSGQEDRTSSSQPDCDVFQRGSNNETVSFLQASETHTSVLDKPRIVVAINTNRKFHDNKASLQAAWFQAQLQSMNGSEAEESFAASMRVVYFTNGPDLSQESWYEEDEESSYESGNDRYLKIVKFFANGCSEDYAEMDWLFVLDDDAVVYPRQFMKLIEAAEHTLDARALPGVILGREATWDPGTIFGGNGLLFSRRAVDELEVSKADWSVSAVPPQKPPWYEPRLQKVVNEAGKTRIASVGVKVCFGENLVRGEQDEIARIKFNLRHQGHGQFEPAATEQRRVTTTLHKLASKTDYDTATAFFSRLDETPVSDFETVLNQTLAAVKGSP